jgi:photosystem II stability/assembly factor-like uncharacterized protein
MGKKLLLIVSLFCLLSASSAQNLDHWTQLGMVKFPENTSVQTTGMGRVSHLAAHPSDSNILFAVSSSGGLWKSSNEAKTWKPLTDAIPNTRCASVLLNPLNPQVLYLGTGDANYNNNGLGVWRSADGGKTWVQTTSGMGNKLVSMLLMHASDTSILVAACRDGIYKSLNRGGTWVKKTSVNTSYRSMVFKPGSRDTIYAASDSKFYRSFDFGETWTELSVFSGLSPAGIQLAVTPANRNLVYLVAWENTVKFGGLYKSGNDGTSFTRQSNSPNILGYSDDGSTLDGQAAYNLTIAVDPADSNKIYVGAIDVWRSVNGGVNWILSSHWHKGVHADKHAFLFSPYNRSKLYLAHDGGVDRTMNGGLTWTTLSDGLSATEFYKMGQSRLRREILSGGMQDNGLNIFNNGIAYTVRGGDWFYDMRFDYRDTNLVYFETGKRRKIEQGTEDDINISAGILTLHPSDTNVMFNGLANIHRTTNLKANPSTNVSWTQISDTLGGNNTGAVNIMDISEADPNILYAAKDNGKLFRTDNCLAATPAYVTLTNPGPSDVTCIAAHPTNANIVFITSGTKLYRSNNKGGAWTDVTGNLPNIALLKVIIDRHSTVSAMYVATALGVYYRDNNLTSWISFSSSMPSIAQITDMEIFQDSGKTDRLRISTFGRGIWSSDLYSGQAIAPGSEFSVQEVTNSGTCSGVYILNDHSTGSPLIKKFTITPAAGWTYINGSDSFSTRPEIRITVPGNYLVTQYVTNAAGSDFSSAVIAYTPVTVQPVCNPPTRDTGFYTIGIYNFTFNTISRKSAHSLYMNPNLEDVSCSRSTIVKAGNTYPVSVTNSTLNNEFCNVYLDYNNNGNFSDAGELVHQFTTGMGTRTGNILIKSTAPVFGQYLRMRVISDFYAITGPCDSLGYGQAEDYAVMIDSVRPLISIELPKPTVSRVFTATLRASEQLSGFDSTDISVTNGSITRLRKTGPMEWQASVKPVNNGTVTLSIASNKCTDLVGNINRPSSDVTNFFMGFLTYTFPGTSITDSIFTLPTGGKVKSTVPAGTTPDSLVATFTLSDSATAKVGSTSQGSGVSKNNFNTAVTYSITSVDGQITNSFEVSVLENTFTDATLLTFGLVSPAAGGTMVQTPTGGTIAVAVPFGTNLSSLVANFTLADSAKAYVSGSLQQSGTTVNNFSSAVNYRVKAKDTLFQKNYLVTVGISNNSGADITSFGFTSPLASGVITPNPGGGLITLMLPYGISRTSLTPVFTLSDSARARVSGTVQYSGQSPQNFTDTVVYIVTSQDLSTTRTFKVVVKNLPNTACRLLTFGFATPAVTGTITHDTTGGTVSVTVPFGTSVANLAALFTVEDSAKVFIGSVQQQSGITQNSFSAAVDYKVIAHDGITERIYKVTVSVAKNAGCDLLSFALKVPAVPGNISPNAGGGTVDVLVISGTNRTNLIAEFTLSDSAVATVGGVTQQSGVTPNDFTSPVTYKVTAQNGIASKQYEVIVIEVLGIPGAEGKRFSVYPNPSSGSFMVTGLSGGRSNIIVSNVLGQRIFEGTTVESSILIDLQQYGKGIYMLECRTGSGNYMLRLIVE